MWTRVREAVRRVALAALGDPLRGSRGQLSEICFDDNGRPTARLIDLALASIRGARDEDLSFIADRMDAPPRWPEIWPGEHYRLLAALVRALAPQTVVEIGTFQGLSALALAKNLPPGGRVHTFDVVSHKRIPGAVLTDADLADGRITAHLADLTGSEGFASHRGLLEAAELIFVDAAKDGVMERRLLARMESLRARPGLLVVFDDIRLWNMLAIWREVKRPKLDLTSFGHWSGTGWIDWDGALAAEPAGERQGAAR